MLHIWTLPVLALVCAVPWAVIRLVMYTPARRVALEAIFIGYVAALAYVTLFLPLSAASKAHGFGWVAVNFVPARSIVGISRDCRGQAMRQLLGNVVLFMPLGLLLPLLGARCRRFALTAAVGLSVSVGIELVQLALLLTQTARRVVDVDDVILNVTGACLGYLVWQGLHALVQRGARRSGARKDAA